LLLGTALTAASWLALIALLFGIGCSVLASLGRRPADWEEALSTFWLGWAAAVVGALLWHFFAPIGPKALGVVGVWGCLGLAMQRTVIAEWLSRLRRRAIASPLEVLLIAAVILLAIAWLANRAMAPITPQGDSGFYHIGAVRWAQSEALLPGLGNVDGRFGFNNAFFLYLALLDWPPGPPHFYHLGTPVLFIVFAAECALHIVCLVRDRAAAASRHFLGALWTASVIPFFFAEFATTSTDTVNLLVGFVLGMHLFRLVFEDSSPRDVAFQGIVVVALATVGVSIKLSFAFLGVFACCVAGWCFVRARSSAFAAGFWPSVRASARPLVGVAAAAGLVLGLWLARGVIMTGYIAYPSVTAVSLDVDWRVPEEQVRRELEIVSVWARFPFPSEKSAEEILEGWDWLGPWLLKTLERADLFTIPMLLFFLGAPYYLRKVQAEGLDFRRALLFMGPVIFAFVLWFVTAPAERFGGAIFWLLGAGMWAILYEQSEALRQGLVRFALVFVSVSVAAGATAGAVLSEQRYGWSLIVSPGPEQGFHPIPEAIVEKHFSDSGVVHYVPVRMRQGSSLWTPGLRCWDAPLPCTSRPMPDLKARQSDDWGGGFRRVLGAEGTEE
jgi:hypothetical protein